MDPKETQNPNKKPIHEVSYGLCQILLSITSLVLALNSGDNAEIILLILEYFSLTRAKLKVGKMLFNKMTADELTVDDMLPSVCVLTKQPQ